MQEWYLLTSETSPNSLGGYENDAFNDYKEDAFNDALQTDIATTVLLCNSDLSEQNELRCIVQENVANTALKSMERTVLANIGTFKTGEYILFEGHYWIINGYPGNNGVYEKVTVTQCQHFLRWQNKYGDIVGRWVSISDETKYSTGKTGNSTVMFLENQYGVIAPVDDEVKAINRGKRFAIDFDDTELPDVYELTNRKVKIREGIIQLSFSISAFNRDVDRYITLEDGTQTWICDYKTMGDLEPIPPTDENRDIKVEFSYRGSATIVAGGNAKVFTATATDENDNVITDYVPQWSVIVMPEFEEYVEYNVDDQNRLSLKAIYTSDIIGSIIKLTADDDKYNSSTSIYITVGGGI